MSEMLLINQNERERSLIQSQSKDAVSMKFDDRIRINSFKKAVEAKKYFQTSPTINMAVWDINTENDIKTIEAFKAHFDDTDVMLVANGMISPMKYMTPRIRACSLLIRPFDDNQSKGIVDEFIDQYYEKNMVQDERSMIIENREGKTVVPFSSIYYIEVREKKIYVRLRNSEYTKYDSLENVIKILPDTFMRCHRSFVFNTQHFSKVKLSENTIYLNHDITVPLSRYYKKEIKEYLNAKRNL